MTIQTLKTGHIGLNVSDLDRSIDFYSEVFGFEVLGRSDVDGRRYAFLGDRERLLVTLWQQATSRYNAAYSGLHHLSFEVPSLEEVRNVETRVRRLGAPIHHGGVVAHGEGTASGGLFFEDPDGSRLEVYTPTGLEGQRSASSDAPTCGFF